MHIRFLYHVALKNFKAAWRQSLKEWRLIRCIAKPHVVTTDQLARHLSVTPEPVKGPNLAH